MNILNIINNVIISASFVLIIIIYIKTKENPPLEGIVLPIFEENSNFALDPQNWMQNDLSRYCQCGEEILNDICSEEQIISGCFDVSKNINRLQLRHLEDIDCYDYNRNVIKNRGEINKVFDLGFDMVNKMALGLIILVSISLCVSVLLSLTTVSLLFQIPEDKECLIDFTIGIYLSSYFATNFVNLILFIIIMVNFYKGKTTGEFLDYYNNCANKNRKLLLKDSFEKLDTLHSLMTAFVTLNSICLCYGCFPAIFFDKWTKEVDMREEVERAKREAIGKKAKKAENEENEENEKGSKSMDLALLSSN